MIILNWNEYSMNCGGIKTCHYWLSLTHRIFSQYTLYHHVKLKKELKMRLKGENFWWNNKKITMVMTWSINMFRILLFECFLVSILSKTVTKCKLFKKCCKLELGSIIDDYNSKLFILRLCIMCWYNDDNQFFQWSNMLIVQGKLFVDIFHLCFTVKHMIRL